jgi:hypothetical protein
MSTVGRSYQATNNKDVAEDTNMCNSEQYSVATRCIKEVNKSDYQSKPCLQPLINVLICSYQMTGFGISIWIVLQESEL